ncbi:hypothetical protein OHS33_32845 [Streptomyces sp. NBC_00536]|uniref:hypothetical protein n=1 Tax=Streptomyces sp. NBC_00536 TaxID=2975769 RepID=UPI002E7FFE05|nr:hypothetical protein [Streptomyces sp. NBC_00536]WUC82732.1 hypothetical protein OHS33_32845 [Streptomyces sp. NBC_00536]
MSVYIGELHTDVVPAAGQGPTGPAPGAADPHAAADRHREACERSAWLAARTAAEAFDD